MEKGEAAVGCLQRKRKQRREGGSGREREGGRQWMACSQSSLSRNPRVKGSTLTEGVHQPKSLEQNGTVTLASALSQLQIILFRCKRCVPDLFVNFMIKDDSHTKNKTADQNNWKW